MVDCIADKEIINKIATYDSLRSQCSARDCNSVDKDDKLGRDFCLHRCVNSFCFGHVYGNVTEVERVEAELRALGGVQMELERKAKRQEFILCTNDQLGKKVSYEGMRMFCAKNYCSLISKQDRLELEKCIHHCINGACYDSVYPSAELPATKQDVFLEELKFKFRRCYDQKIKTEL